MIPPHEMPQPLGIFAGEQFERAGQYLDAFERLAGTPEPLPLYPMYFLLTQAIELFLKSFLAARGMSKKELRGGVRHDLHGLLALCNARQFPVVADLAECVGALQEMNKDYDFRYVTGYTLRVPPPAYCLETGKKLESALAKIMAHAHIEAMVHFAAETRHLVNRRSTGTPYRHPKGALTHIR